MGRSLFLVGLCALVFYTLRSLRNRSAPAVRHRRRDRAGHSARARQTLVRDPETGEYSVEQD